ncbi:MAG: hypothetical protein FIB01_09460 [Gemmatimonadetes bacterium]|nr:hypothetical protein [Gemmatimonadota bacterium]
MLGSKASNRRGSPRAVIVLALGLAGCGPGLRAPGSEAAPRAAGDSSRANSTGSVLTDSALARMRYQRFADVIEGRFPGVRVEHYQNGEIGIRIRGAGAFQGRNEPLYLLDGMEIQASSLLQINPEDITRIEVIKDAMAAAYGVRGANGVIMITTRRRESERPPA